jgi:hypothetical protein
MRFASKAECEALFGRLGFDSNGPIAGSRATRQKTFEGFYRSPLASPAYVSKVLATGQGDFTACCLWADDVLGESRNTPAHGRYRRWRRAHDEDQSLYDAPGHMFEEGESELLAEVIEMAMEIGWNALVLAKPVRPVIQISHDDWIALHARGRPSALIRRLDALGIAMKQRKLD